MSDEKAYQFILAVFEIRRLAGIGGDHVIHVGRIERFDVMGGEPLLFYQGRYRQLAEA